MTIFLFILFYLVIGFILFVTIVRLEKAKIITFFDIKGYEYLMVVVTELCWPIVLILCIVALPGTWAKHYFKQP
jgi:hypothetical protein